MSEQTAAARAADKAAQGGALAKLLAFAVVLAVLPIGSYFGSLWYIWNGDAIKAAVTAVVAANVVLITYILTSVQEDRDNMAKAEADLKAFEQKKTR